MGGRRGEKKLTTKQPLGTEVAFRREYLSTPWKCEPGEIENKGTFMNFQRTCLPHESPDAFGHAALTIFERGCSGWGYCWLQQTRWFDSRLKMTYLWLCWNVCFPFCCRAVRCDASHLSCPLVCSPLVSACPQTPEQPAEWVDSFCFATLFFVTLRNLKNNKSF